MLFRSSIAVVNYLFPKIPIRSIKEGILDTVWPGRFEVISRQPLIILDGAHNRHGVEALTYSMKTMYPQAQIHTLFCAMADKETSLMLEMISNISSSVTVTHFDYKRVAELAILLEQTPHPHKKAIEDPILAVETIVSTIGEDSILLITGSLYFVSYIRPYLLNKFNLA